MELLTFTTIGLGDNSYLLISGDEAAMVDPQRDTWRVLEVIRARRLRLRYILETHIHNDYLSGALELRHFTGAEILAPAAGGLEFPHQGVVDGQTFELGKLRLTVMETPGHTPDHVAWLVSETPESEPQAVFSGGSLVVGGAGRTDLLGFDQVVPLARAQYASVRRLAALPEQAKLYPTHGGGSFCAAYASRQRTSTIGAERATNQVLHMTDEESFVRAHLASLREYPTYYREMAAINRHGPSPMRHLPWLRLLEPLEVTARTARGCWVVDARDRADFAAAHVPGSVHVELGETFGTYVGWIVPFGTPLVLVLPEPAAESWREAAVQLVRIGYDDLQGGLAGGLAAWSVAGLPVRSTPTAGLDALCAAWSEPERTIELLDVRQQSEWVEGHVAGSRHIFLGELRARTAELPRDREIWAACATGYRAFMAASLLEREGFSPRVLNPGGISRFLDECPAAARPL